MNKLEKIITLLEDLNIEYELVSHPRASTTELADSFIEGIEGVRSKTMFMTNGKKKEFYLLTMDDQKRLDFHRFQELTGTKRVKFASDQLLHDKIDSTPGIVTIFDLLQNPEHDIQVFFDRDILKEPRQSFSPSDFYHTIFISTADTLKLIDHLGYEAQIIDL